MQFTYQQGRGKAVTMAAFGHHLATGDHRTRYSCSSTRCGWKRPRPGARTLLLTLLTTFAMEPVVPASEKIDAFLPWQIPVNQLASDPARAQLALALGCVGGCVAFQLMSWRLSQREVLG